MKYKEKLIDYSKADYECFKDWVKSFSLDQIYDYSGKIYFYKEMNNYFKGENNLNEETCEFLCLFGVDILDRLYENFLDMPGYSVNTWSDIEVFIEEYRYNHDENYNRQGIKTEQNEM